MLFGLLLSALTVHHTKNCLQKSIVLCSSIPCPCPSIDTSALEEHGYVVVFYVSRLSTSAYHRHSVHTFSRSNSVPTALEVFLSSLTGEVYFQSSSTLWPTSFHPRVLTTMQVLIEINLKNYCMLGKGIERGEDVELGRQTLYKGRRLPSSCGQKDCSCSFDVRLFETKFSYLVEPYRCTCSE